MTLWGPAGIGKTRIALAVAADSQVALGFSDIVFVDVAPVREPSGVMQAIGEAFGLSDASHPLATLELLDSLVSDRQVLLILDNLEHVLEFGPQLVPLLANCPGVKILATSRAALRLRWECAFPVAPLAVPNGQLPVDAGSAIEYAGIALFVDRARAVNPDFQLTDANAAVIAEVCARLDGLPLALELAAARTKGWPLLVLLKRLDDRLELLQSGAPDLPSRQQTLRRALMWSYDLLDKDQQALFAQFSVFDDGCSPDVAEAVCSASQPESDVLDGLAVLVNHSLLRLKEAGGAEPRYTQLAIIRDYAQEQLRRSGQAPEIRMRHATHYLSVAEQADRDLSGPRQVGSLERLEREHNNLRAALRWALECDNAETGLRLASALSRFWLIHGHLSEGRSWLRRLLALSSAEKAGLARAKGLAAAALLAEAQGEYAEAASLHEQSLLVCRHADDDEGIADAFRSLGVLARHADNQALASERFDRSLAIFRAAGSMTGTARVLQDLGTMCLDAGEVAGARAYLNDSLSICREAGDVRGISLAYVGLARVALADKEFMRADSLLSDALGMLRQLDDRQTIALVLELFACVAAQAGEAARALRLVGAADSLRSAVAAHAAPHWRSNVEAHQVATGRELGLAASAGARSEGRALTLDEAVQLCLGQQGVAQDGECPKEVVVNGCLEEFTRREREVIELAVLGWSNRQIANKLVISERTVEGHIHNVLGKLQLASRAQLVAWRARLGVVMADGGLLAGSAGS